MVGVAKLRSGRGTVIAERLFPAAPARDSPGDLFFGHSSGRGSGFLLGGWVGQHFGWRWAFYLLGFPDCS